VAFKKIPPVIQGVATPRGKMHRPDERSEAVEFSLEAFEITPESQAAVVTKIE
jgi:hypothetical protein